MDDLSDQELVAMVLDGHADRFGALVRRYQGRYFTFATRMLGSREDADDALQSAFIRAYRSLANCQEPARFGAWLHRIVLNECRSLAMRRARRENRLSRDEAVLANIRVEHPADRQADLAEIQRAVDRLDVEQREAFLLKHVQELEYEEMATLTGSSIPALKMRVMRARERLRELLGDRQEVS